MALIDDMKKKADAQQAAYKASLARGNTATQQAQAIQIPAPVVMEGRSWNPRITAPDTNAATAANAALGGISRTETTKQVGMIPAFKEQAAGFRQVAAQDRATAAQQGANRLLQSVGAQPVAPRPLPTPAAALPNFNNVVGGMKSNFGPPSQQMTGNQADARERNAASAPPAGPAQARGGLSTTSGGSASTFVTGDGRNAVLPGGVAVVKQANGVNAFGATGASVAAAQTPASSLATRPLPAAAAATPTSYSAARPQVASTFGQPVTAMAEAPVAPRPSGSFREPGAMGEQYNKTEDRRAREKQLSDLDSQRFRLEMIAGNPGRRGREAIQALAGNAQDQSALVNEGAKLTADAIANRARNENTLANTQMQEQAQSERQGLDLAAGLGLEGIRQGGENERARLAARPTAQTQLAAAAKAAGVNGDILKAYSDQANAITSNVTMAPEEKQAAMAALEGSPLGQRYTQELGGGGGAQGGGAPPAAAIDHLKKNPALAAQFEEQFNLPKGSAASYLK